ncbi:MAG: hypothetical protein HY360_10365 [Verrucomicrobia bacterium]|nr:hypothetical protein [Verrucomicrobiota bacterium]
MTLRAHFDGTVIVPDEPADLPVNVPLDVEIKAANSISPEVAAAMESAHDPKVIAEKLAALKRIASRARKRHDPLIPDEMLRREHLYDDRV